MSNPDTHFASYASLLFDELKNNACITLADHPNFERMVELQEKIEAIAKQIIARRAYDLVVHVLSNEKLQWYPLEAISVSDIPDLTEFPKEQMHGSTTINQ